MPAWFLSQALLHCLASPWSGHKQLKLPIWLPNICKTQRTCKQLATFDWVTSSFFSQDKCAHEQPQRELHSLQRYMQTNLLLCKLLGGFPLHRPHCPTLSDPPDLVSLYRLFTIQIICSPTNLHSKLFTHLSIYTLNSIDLKYVPL